MAQNFSSLLPRQKWFYERRNMQVGDVVLLQYEGKCRPATYSLAVVVDVEVDGDGLVRTVSVEYSLLAELPASERLSYKGVTKKRIRVSVQRLVLILPVEEADRNNLPGEKAGGDQAPPDEVSEHDQGVKVQHSSAYEVIWDIENNKYVRGNYSGEAAVIGDQSGGAAVQGVHSEAAGDQHVRVEGQGQGLGHRREGEQGASDVGLGREQGQGDHSIAGGLAVGAHGPCEGGVSSEMRQSLRCNAVFKSKVECKDFEKEVYDQKSKAFDWKKIFENLVVPKN